jgi:hypothetical protein
MPKNFACFKTQAIDSSIRRGEKPAATISVFIKLLIADG